jgi:very-short-patch-repair endonuclease
MKAKTDFSRRLRRDQTDRKRRLWALLRNRQLDGFKFRRQLPIDRYVADFVCEEAMLVVELDCGQRAAQESYDAGRTAVLEAAGYRVLRFWNNEVIEGAEGVLRAILVQLRAGRA